MTVPTCFTENPNQSTLCIGARQKSDIDLRHVGNGSVPVRILTEKPGTPLGAGTSTC